MLTMYCIDWHYYYSTVLSFCIRVRSIESIERDLDGLTKVVKSSLGKGVAFSDQGLDLNG